MLENVKEDIQIVFTRGLALGGTKINKSRAVVMLWIMRGPKGQFLGKNIQLKEG